MCRRGGGIISTVNFWCLPFTWMNPVTTKELAMRAVVSNFKSLTICIIITCVETISGIFCIPVLRPTNICILPVVATLSIIDVVIARPRYW